MDYIKKKNPTTDELKGKRRVNNYLSLKKRKFEKVFSTFRNLKWNPSAEYEIQASQINLSPEININFEDFISNQYQVKNYAKELLSNDTECIKRSLFLLREYINRQINKELNQENRKFTGNLYDIFKRLFEFLNHPDFQIKYEAMNCLIGLSFFHESITKYLSIEENLCELFKFFENKNYDNTILYYGLLLVRYLMFVEKVRLTVLGKSYEPTPPGAQPMNIFDTLNGLIDICNPELENEILVIYRVLTDYYSKDLEKSVIFQQIIPVTSVLLKKYSQCLINQKHDLPDPISENLENILSVVENMSLLIMQNGYTLIDVVNENIQTVMDIFYYSGAMELRVKEKCLLIISNISQADPSSLHRILDNSGIEAFFLQCLEAYSGANRELLQIVLFSIANIVAGDLPFSMSFLDNGIVLKLNEIGNLFTNLAEQYPGDKVANDNLVELMFCITNLFLLHNQELNNTIFPMFYPQILRYIKQAYISGGREGKLVHSLLVTNYYLIRLANNMIDFQDFRNNFYQMGMEEFYANLLNRRLLFNEENERIAGLILDSMRGGVDGNAVDTDLVVEMDENN
ncbi:MAG: hypothetical protein MJ252_10055 [archaeon]|nr:hypothetical protein [archaeon]